MAELLDWGRAIQTYQGTPPQPPQAQPLQAEPIAQPAPPAANIAPPVVQPPVMPTATVTNSRGAMSEMDQLAAIQGDAIQAQADARAGGLQQQSALATQQAAMEQSALAQQEEQTAAYQAQREQLQQQYADLNDQASRSQAIDSRSSGQKAMGILAVALGGLGDAFSAMGGSRTNMGAQISAGIESAVDRDIQLQKDAIGSKRQAAAAKLSELGLARQFFGDDKAAEEFARASRKEMYATQMDALAKQSQIPQVQAQATEAAAKARAESAEKKASLLASKENNVFSAMAANGRAQANQQRPLSATEQLAIDRYNRDLAKDEAVRQQKNIPGLEMLVSPDEVTGEDKKEAQRAKVMYDNATSGLSALKTLAADSGPTARKSFTLKREQVIANLTQAAGSGVPGAAEALKFAEGLPEPTLLPIDTRIGDTNKIYDNAIQGMKDLKRTTLETYKYREAESKPKAAPKSPMERSESARTGNSAPAAVPMTAPDGRQLMVPPDQVQRLESLGAKRL